MEIVNKETVETVSMMKMINDPVSKTVYNIIKEITVGIVMKGGKSIKDQHPQSSLSQRQHQKRQQQPMYQQQQQRQKQPMYQQQRQPMYQKQQPMHRQQQQQKQQNQPSKSKHRNQRRKEMKRLYWALSRLDKKFSKKE